MQKTLPDGSEFVSTYKMPDNVAALVREIEERACKTYPDHKESQVAMIKQELIQALSEKVELVVRYRQYSSGGVVQGSFEPIPLNPQTT